MNNWIYLALFALFLVQAEAGTSACVLTSTTIPWQEFTDAFCDSDYTAGAVTASPWELLTSGVNIYCLKFYESLPCSSELLLVFERRFLILQYILSHVAI